MEKEKTHLYCSACGKVLKDSDSVVQKLKQLGKEYGKAVKKCSGAYEKRELSDVSDECFILTVKKGRKGDVDEAWNALEQFVRLQKSNLACDKCSQTYHQPKYCIHDGSELKSYHRIGPSGSPAEFGTCDKCGHRAEISVYIR